MRMKNTNLTLTLWLRCTKSNFRWDHGFSYLRLFGAVHEPGMQNRSILKCFILCLRDVHYRPSRFLNETFYAPHIYWILTISLLFLEANVILALPLTFESFSHCKIYFIILEFFKKFFWTLCISRRKKLSICRGTLKTTWNCMTAFYLQ